ncbi:hypothetical protein RIF29_24195 [Crotalaria pallida]|uniref:Uncharacterized protein n=1 Tax=Crotalaria pallida TaxID=3830 RepID=A0AAN9EJC2_CROPI
MAYPSSSSSSYPSSSLSSSSFSYDGTNKIQIIVWEMKNYNDTIDFDGKTFKKMEKLKTFILHVGKADYFNGDLDYLPNSLRVLEWQYYSFLSLPFGSHPDKLNILRLSHCRLKSLGLFKIEKVLYLSDCNDLLEIRWIPPNLEELCASGCESLKYLDLTSSPCLLRTLKLDDCNALEEIRGIPPTIQVLSATNCTSLTDSCRRMLLNQGVAFQSGSNTAAWDTRSLFGFAAWIQIQQKNHLSVEAPMSKLEELKSSHASSSTMPSTKETTDDESSKDGL